MGGTGNGYPAPLPNTRPSLVTSFAAAELTALRHRVAAFSAATGLHGDRLDDFVFAVYELLTNVVRHGGGTGLLSLEQVDGDLVCQVDDDGPGIGPEALSQQPSLRTGGRGLWLARQLTDSLIISDRAPGTSVLVRMAILRPDLHPRTA